MPSRASLTAVVTSSVLASGFLETATPMPGLPLVREMLLGLPGPNVTSATSDSRTGPDSDTPTTRSFTSWTESSVCVVLAMTARPPSKTRPAGRVRLFSLRAAEIWKRETPFAASLSESATTWTFCSTSPLSTTRITPSTSETAGRMRDCTMPWTSYKSLSETTLNCMTGI